MPKSRKDKSREDKVKNFKQDHTSQQNQQDSLLNDPNLRQYPVWPANAQIVMYGKEFEQIFNFINGVQGAYAAVQSIMNRNVLEGIIKMKFEKAGPDGQSIPLTEEQEKPYQQEFAKVLAQAKEIAKHAVEQSQQLEPPSQEGVPNLNDIVDESGKPYEKEVAQVPDMRLVE